MSIFPVISFAALDGLKTLLTGFKDIINLLIPVVIGLAVIFFLWGTGQFILHAGDQKLRDEGKKKMLWGVIALFVMISIVGILTLISNTLGIPANQSLPEFQGDAIPGTTNG